MRLALTSDLHGCLPAVPRSDVLLIAGDLCPLDEHGHEYQAEWLRSVFRPWLAAAPARHKLFIAGNHDFVFACQPELLDGIDWPGIYLQDSGAVCEDVAFWGSPWVSKLPGWAFTAPEDELALCWEQVPAETEVLLVHGPPRGTGDVVIGSRTGDRLHVGSRALAEALDCLPCLRLVVCGHIHESHGVYERGALTLVNASLMDGCYRPTNPVLLFDLD